MKLLTLIRHAKSDWTNADLTDFDRSLSSRGKENVPFLTEKVFNGGIVPIPELLLSSTSKRTCETISLVQKNLTKNLTEVMLLEELYLASTRLMESAIAGVNDSIDHCAVCAHNPGITDFANVLTRANIESVPTFGIVHIELNINSWTEIFAASGTLLAYEYPKKYE